MADSAHIRSRLTLVLLLAVPVGAGGATAQEEVRSLFDGASLGAWDGDPRFWSVEDGAIVGRSTAEQPCDGTTYLVWTGEEYGDFELELEYRLVGGNSGVQLRSRRDAGWQVSGYQADLEDGPSWSGCIYEHNGRGVMVRRGEQVVHGSDGTVARERFGDGEALLRGVRTHDWNTYRIVAHGARIELWINGVRMSALVDRAPGHARRSGTFALQLHAGPPMEVRFRNLRLRELAPADDEPAQETAGGADPDCAGVPGDPRWIWRSGTTSGDEVALFRKRFETRGAPTRATLTATCDNAMQVHLDGAPVLESGRWWVPVAVDVTELLAAGRHHQLAVCGKNEGGPAALLVVLELEYEGGAREVVVTDASWRASAELPGDAWRGRDFDDSGWAPAVELGALGVSTWGAPGILGDGTQDPFANFDIVWGQVVFDPPVIDIDITPTPPTGRRPQWPEGGAPHWIWLRTPAGARDVACFRKTLEVRAGLERATLSATCDNVMEVFLDGESVATGDNWGAPVQVEVTERLAPGRHVLAARGENQGAPAGLLLVLELEYAGGEREVLVTDGSWRVAPDVAGDAWRSLDHDDGDWLPAIDLGRLGCAPWGTPGFFEGTR